VVRLAAGDAVARSFRVANIAPVFIASESSHTPANEEGSGREEVGGAEEPCWAARGQKFHGLAPNRD
jgi:hypothetical protein